MKKAGAIAPAFFEFPSIASVDETEDDRPQKHEDQTDSQKTNFAGHECLQISLGPMSLPRKKKIRKA